jgi:hypothetical protein
MSIKIILLNLLFRETLNDLYFHLDSAGAIGGSFIINYYFTVA